MRIIRQVGGWSDELNCPADCRVTEVRRRSSSKQKLCLLIRTRNGNDELDAPHAGGLGSRRCASSLFLVLGVAIRTRRPASKFQRPDSVEFEGTNAAQTEQIERRAHLPINPADQRPLVRRLLLRTAR